MELCSGGGGVFLFGLGDGFGAGDWRGSDDRGDNRSVLSGPLVAAVTSLFSDGDVAVDDVVAARSGSAAGSSLFVRNVFIIYSILMLGIFMKHLLGSLQLT
mmetsp:Transcript_23038/g.49876  ORF Transcript_23038/g.49876 Transcript_23038/m.49876 type:complete len:101 (-) Transcript_23038:84-386(-)